MEYTEILPVIQNPIKTTHDINLILHFLKSLDDFKLFAAKLPVAALHALATEFELEEYRPGQILFRKGDDSNKLYIILKGTIDLYDTKPSKIKELVSKATEGKIIGDRGLLRREQRSLSAQVKQHSYLLTLSASKFKSIMHSTLYQYFEHKLQFLEKHIPKIVKYPLLLKEKLAYAMEYVIFRKGDVILEVNREITHVYYILEGECQMLSKFFSMNSNMLYLGTGSSIGEEAILLSKPSDCTVKACTEYVKTFRIKRETYLTTMPDEILQLNKELSVAKENERKYLNSCHSLPSLNNSNKLRVAPKHIWDLASPSARRNINNFYMRRTEIGTRAVKHPRNRQVFKEKLERLRDITSGRFYKYNSPLHTVTTEALVRTSRAGSVNE